MKTVKIGSMLDQLDLNEDDFDDLVLPNDNPEIVESRRWLLSRQ